MTEKYDVIFNAYKKFIEENSQHGARVVKYNTNTSAYFPLITFIQSNNIDLDRNSLYNIDYFEAYYFTINIYTKDKKSGATMIASQEIAKELVSLTTDFFRKINFKKTLSRPIPNLDESILRYTMQYQCQIGNKGNIIRR